MRIRGTTKLVGLFGWPVEHSISPQMQNAAFQAQGLDWCYLPFPVPPSDLPAAVAGLSALGVRGVNVTVPHKEAIAPLLYEVRREAQVLQAVNTVTSDNGRLVGHNTDVYGVQMALQEAGFSPQGCHALVLGAGGAARAVVYALLREGASVELLARREAQARTLVSTMAEAFPDSTVSAGLLQPDGLVGGSETAHLLVNATPLGMWPEVDGTPWPETHPIPSHLTVFDLVYRPRRTRLLQQAAEAGAEIIPGLGMLIHQGARSYQLWTGRQPPVQTMVDVCERALCAST